LWNSTFWQNPAEVTIEQKFENNGNCVSSKLGKNWSAMFGILDITVGVYFDKSNYLFVTHTKNSLTLGFMSQIEIVENIIEFVAYYD
jgi:hypothetical protein